MIRLKYISIIPNKEDLDLNDKLYKLLKYEGGTFNIEVSKDIENGFNKEES